MKSIKMGKYTDMGLTQSQIMEMDPTPDGTISHEDAVTITSSILRDDDMLKNYLAEYYTKAMEQNYYNNLSPEVREAMQMKQNSEANPKSKTVSKNFKNPLSQLKGGKVVDGIFVSNK